MSASMQVGSALGTESEEEMLLNEEAKPLTIRRIGFGTAAALLGCAALAATAYGVSRPAAVRDQTLTVHSLLEDESIAQVATDNIMAHGTIEGRRLAEGADEPTSRAEALASVKKSMAELQATLRAKIPEDLQKKMADLKINPEQKEKLMAGLKLKFSDPRSVGASKSIKDLLSQSRAAGDSPEAARRRLAEGMLPHARELQSLAEELHPGGFKFDSKSMGVSDAWKPELSIDFGASKGPFLRRLAAISAAYDIDNGVKSQVRSMYHSLEEDFGDEMPTAPARMLSTSDSTETSFMSCLAKAVPSPTEVCSCLADNMQEAMHMVMSMLKGKSP